MAFKKLTVVATLPAVALLAGCGDKLPTGEAAMREIIPAITGAGPEAPSERMAVEIATFTVSMAGGFAGEELAGQWSDAVVAKKVAAALEPKRKAAADALYADLAKTLDAETTKEIVADVRDPAKLKALKCAYKPEGTFGFPDCDTAALGKAEDYLPRYVKLKEAMDKAAETPAALGTAGTAACDVSDEFLAAAKKANPDFTSEGLKITRNGTPYTCETFRGLAGGSAAAKKKEPA